MKGGPPLRLLAEAAFAFFSLACLPISICMKSKSVQTLLAGEKEDKEISRLVACVCCVQPTFVLQLNIYVIVDRKGCARQTKNQYMYRGK